MLCQSSHRRSWIFHDLEDTNTRKNTTRSRWFTRRRAIAFLGVTSIAIIALCVNQESSVLSSLHRRLNSMENAAKVIQGAVTALVSKANAAVHTEIQNTITVQERHDLLVKDLETANRLLKLEQGKTAQLNDQLATFNAIKEQLTTKTTAFQESQDRNEMLTEQLNTAQHATGRLTTQNRALTKQVTDLKEEHEKLVNDLKEEHEKLVNDLKEEHEKLVNDLKEEHKKDIQNALTTQSKRLAQENAVKFQAHHTKLKASIEKQFQTQYTKVLEKERKELEAKAKVNVEKVTTQFSEFKEVTRKTITEAKVNVEKVTKELSEYKKDTRKLTNNFQKTIKQLHQTITKLNDAGWKLLDAYTKSLTGWVAKEIWIAVDTLFIVPVQPARETPKPRPRKRAFSGTDAYDEHADLKTLLRESKRVVGKYGYTLDLDY